MYANLITVMKISFNALWFTLMSVESHRHKAINAFFFAF